MRTFIMVRKYIKKTNGPAYTIEDLDRAVSDVVNKNRTYRQAHETYNIPISVIFHRIKGRNIPLNKMGAGRSQALSTEVEKQIVKCLIARSRMGYPCDKNELFQLVADYVSVNNIKTPFKDNKLGPDWYYSFINRHPQLSFKKPEHLQKLRKTARDPEVVYDFYEKLKALMETSNLTDPE
ncbi:hypothetical protein NQ314_007592 [Rhamnusium bicolor]|uniref:HTH psq-type domain-containing protein n=1 Tax=Rhamnusium bicolor TaxID=1586634 RepID=A0AAV8YLG1_9CUCU|nr:hypothetical protein NQ314_007592 [Rhamnusium bicolor]